VRYLFVPTMLNLGLAYLLLRLFYRHEMEAKLTAPAPEPLSDPRLARATKVSLVLLVLLICAKVAIVLAGLPFDFKLTYIALAAALPVLLFTPWRPRVLVNMDWFTLIFFAAMFVLMQSVWDAGLVQEAIARTSIDLAATGIIFPASILLSQVLSNVPLVALYLPVLMHLGAGPGQMLALAAGSTIAGNLTILGAASNVIIIQNAERQGETLTFWEFVRVGVPLTVLNALVYWLFLHLFSP
jgi:Na+/H+ antiporter NhaD/arsenite permease-like protein